jgi:hypothetical protein
VRNDQYAERPSRELDDGSSSASKRSTIFGHGGHLRQAIQIDLAARAPLESFSCRKAFCSSFVFIHSSPPFVGARIRPGGLRPILDAAESAAALDTRPLDCSWAMWNLVQRQTLLYSRLRDKLLGLLSGND